MAVIFSSLPWKAIGRGVAVAYGISFVSGLLLLANGITPQTDQALYPLLAILSGAVGIAVALRVIGTTAISHMLFLGVGLWLFNLSSVLLGAQTLTGWLDSSAFIVTTMIAGRLLVGNSLAPLPDSAGTPG